MKKFITIITPTYNRSKEIKVLYESLKTQSLKSFEWLIVDDGSTDNTKDIVNSMILENIISIKYIEKNNGGKHTALNVAFDNLKTELFFVVDSDDLLPYDSIETIHRYFKKYKNKNLAGFVFLRAYNKDKLLSVKFTKDESIGEYKDIINNLPQCDRAEVFYTEILGSNRFPEFLNEKFIGEGFFWSKIAKNKKMLFANKAIYYCEYLENGLTKSGRKLRINNPLGGMEHAKEYLDSEYSLKIRVKNTMLYLIYYRFAKNKNLSIKKLDNSFIKFVCYIPSYVIYKYWYLKYKN